MKIYLTHVQYVGRDLSSPQLTSLQLVMVWSKIARVVICRGEQIKGYQRNPVIARQLIVSPGTKQRHFFCLLIRFALVRSAEPLRLCKRLVEGKERLWLQQHPLGEAALSHNRATTTKTVHPVLFQRGGISGCTILSIVNKH